MTPNETSGISMAVLGSGSGGNATLIRCGSTHVLVDAGLSARQIVQRMATLGVDPGQLDGILLTHEHGDHINGIDVLLRTRDIPVYTNAMTREMLIDRMKSEIRWKMFRSGQAFELGEFSIRAFKIPHDAVEPVGFVFNGQNTQLGVVSDVGYVTESIREHLRGSHGIYIEANYDQTLLERDTKRPWGTKQRIVSRHGHLSNTETAGLLAEIACERLSHVMLSHLSPDCNCPDLASQTVRDQLAERGHGSVQVQCARQDEPSEWIKIAAGAGV